MSAPENSPAFPFNENNHDGSHYYSHTGMTMRDYFAGKFLAGAAASPDTALDIPADARQHEVDAALAEHWGQAARAAYIAADAMLAAREGAAS